MMRRRVARTMIFSRPTIAVIAFVFVAAYVVLNRNVPKSIKQVMLAGPLTGNNSYTKWVYSSHGSISFDGADSKAVELGTIHGTSIFEEVGRPRVFERAITLTAPTFDPKPGSPGVAPSSDQLWRLALEAMSMEWNHVEVSDLAAAEPNKRYVFFHDDAAWWHDVWASLRERTPMTFWAPLIGALGFVVFCALARRSAPVWACQRCGYDLRTISGTVCPECGTARLVNPEGA